MPVSGSTYPDGHGYYNRQLVNLGGLTGQPDTYSPATTSTEDPSARNGAVIGMMPHWEPIISVSAERWLSATTPSELFRENHLKTTTPITGESFTRRCRPLFNGWHHKQREQFLGVAYTLKAEIRSIGTTGHSMSPVTAHHSTSFAVRCWWMHCYSGTATA